MKKLALAHCEVGLNTQECEFPPSSRDPLLEPLQTRCYGCGCVACKACSRLQNWHGKFSRICNDCVGEYQDLLIAEDKTYQMLAGNVLMGVNVSLLFFDDTTGKPAWRHYTTGSEQHDRFSIGQRRMTLFARPGSGHKNTHVSVETRLTIGWIA